MSWDLALGPTNDLILSPSGDFLGVQGINLIEQRIRLRLKIRRGSWVYDTDGTLGSRIDSLLSKTSQQAISEVGAFVHEALDSMDDISVTNIEVEPSDNGRTMVLLVGFVQNVDPDAAPFVPVDEQINETTIQFQL